MSPAQRTLDVLDGQRKQEDFEAKANDKSRRPYAQRFQILKSEGYNFLF